MMPVVYKKTAMAAPARRPMGPAVAMGTPALPEEVLDPVAEPEADADSLDESLVEDDLWPDLVLVEVSVELVVWLFTALLDLVRVEPAELDP